MAGRDGDGAALMPVPRRAGRPSVTTHSQIEHAAFELFERDGFEETTVDDIAAAVGIGRRTFFRYFASKNDVPWGSFEEELEVMRAMFAAIPDDVPLMAAVRHAVLEFNRVEPAEQPWHRRRLGLILTTPALQAHSTLRYRAWRHVVAEFAARRLGVEPDALLAQAIGGAALGVAVAAYDRWLEEPGADLLDLLDDAFRSLERGFALEGLADARR